MDHKRILGIVLCTLGVAGFAANANADTAAGKAKFEEACSECHEVGDFAGEDAATLTATLKKIVAGQQKHKTALKLSDAEIASLAAYMAAGK
jgi:cytochrome c553